MLESIGAIIGLVAGFKLVAGLPDESVAHPDEARQDEEEPGPTGGASAGLAERVVTVMLAGQPLAGKTLFCSQLGASPSGRPGERTTLLAWRRADVSLAGLDPRREAEVTRVCFQILDTPGSSTFQSLLAPFYRQCAIVVLMFDTCSAASFNQLRDVWLPMVRQQRLGLPNAPRSTVVVANLMDEWRAREVPRRTAAEWATREGLPFFELHVKAKDPSGPHQLLLLHLARVALGIQL